MITIPKPNFAETNVPIGQSKDDYKDEILAKQTHVLNDAIDRVSLRNFIRRKWFSSKISFNVCELAKVATSSRCYIMSSASLLSRLQSISVSSPNF